MDQKRRILFVDDEPGIRLTLPLILEREGFEVSVAASVTEAVSLINTQNFDVLVSDLNIGEPGDGFTVVSVMRRVQPEAVTFILTGFPDFESALRAIRNQVDDYLTKPASIENLVATLKQRLLDRQPRRAIRVQRPAEFLEKHSGTILDAWVNAAEQDGDLASRKLTRAERLNMMESIFVGVCRQVHRGQNALDFKTKEAAGTHGVQRLAQKYTAALIVSEERLLQRCIVQSLQDNLISLDVSELLPDVINIVDQLSLCTEESLRTFQQTLQSETKPLPLRHA